MSQEYPSVPIITLTGVASLSDLLLELPLPTPVPQSPSYKSLFFHPKLAEKCQIFLVEPVDALVAELVHFLVQTSPNEIDVNDHYACLVHGVQQQDGMPQLLKAVLCINPDVFSGLSPAQASDAPAQTTISVTYDNEMDTTIINTSVLPLPNKNQKDQSNSISTENFLPKKEPQSVTILQPFVKLERLLIDFADPKMNITKSTRSGRVKYDKNIAVEEETDSETEASPKKIKTEEKNCVNENDENTPNVFFTLAGSSTKKKNTSKNEKQVVLYKCKLRRVKKEFVPVLKNLSFEELMVENTTPKFNKTVDLVIKSASDHDSLEIGEDEMVQDEYLLSKDLMQDLRSQSVKLKTLGVIEMIATDKLLRVLRIMELNIRGGDRASPIPDEDNETLHQIWMTTTMERVMTAADACLVALYIMTSSNIPEPIYLKDLIDRVVLFIKYQLHNTIFPSFDSTYRLDNKNKEDREKKYPQIPHINIILVYNKIIKMVNLLDELLNIQVLTDTSVFHASSMAVSSFFVEGISELHYACLKFVTTIFTRYENHHKVLLDDMLSSITSSRGSKLTLRTYRLNNEKHIQMLTALILNLIQCIVTLPENLADEKNDDNNENIRKVDKDVLICNKYEKATLTAGTFLAVFLRKSGNENDDIDYRPFFENFVQDLLSTLNKPEFPATKLLLTLIGNTLINNFSNKDADMSLRVASLDYLAVIAACLRKDSILCQRRKSTIDQMVKDIKLKELEDNDEDSSTKEKRIEIESEEERIQFLQRVLLDFLTTDTENNVA